ncbi:hypothetical protein CPC08DRAFT_774969 [Agrocybe pediades]|nr:hypothetical protein CPC08DRAFT_774969 [Agrocybe pediades]
MSSQAVSQALLSGNFHDESTPEQRADVLLKLRKVADLRISIGYVDLGDGRSAIVVHPVHRQQILNGEFVRQNTSLPIPRLLMLFEAEIRKAKLVVAVTTQIEGKRFSRALINKELSPEDLSAIVRSIAGWMDEIRRLPLAPLSPPSKIGTCSGGPFSHEQFTSEHTESEDVRPKAAFTDTQEFHDYWWARAESSRAWYEPRVEPLPTTDVDATRESVLAHGNLDPTNLMVNNGKVVAILRWGSFGWWPEFWEKYALWIASRGYPLWEDVVEEHFEKPAPVFHPSENRF